MAFTKSFRFCVNLFDDFCVNLFDDALEVVCRLLSTCGCICFIHYIILHIFLIVKRFFSHSGGISRYKGLKSPRINFRTGSRWFKSGLRHQVLGLLLKSIVLFLFRGRNDGCIVKCSLC